MEDVTPGSEYTALRETAAALQASLANGLNDLPPELSSSLDTAPKPAPNAAFGTPSMTPAGTPLTRQPDPTVVPAAGGLPAAVRPEGNDLTPIFHALAGGCTGKQPEQADRGPQVDPDIDIWRDPLSAPIPTQATSDLGQMADVRPLRPLSAGRHRRDRPAASESASMR